MSRVNVAGLLVMSGDEIEHVLAVESEDAAGARAVTVDAEGGHASDDVGITDKVRAAGITKAGSAGVGVVREQQREVARKAGDVDLQQARISHHAHLDVVGLPIGSVGEGLLQAVTHRGEGQFIQPAFGFIGVQLVGRGQRAVFVQVAGFAQADHAHVMQHKRAGLEEGMRPPGFSLNGVRSGVWIIVVAGLHIRFGEDTHARIHPVRIVRGAMAGGDHRPGRDLRAAAAVHRLAANFHQDQHDVGMTFAVQFAVRDGAGSANQPKYQHQSDQNCQDRSFHFSSGR